MYRWILLLCLCWPSGLQAQTGGYLKMLGLTGRSVVTQERYQLLLMRLRLQDRRYLRSWLETEVWLDSELLAGNYLETPDYALARQARPETWLDLSRTSIRGKHFRTEHRLERAYVHLLLGPVDAYVGRQRIAWGTGFVWHPTDLFNPTDPLAIEREEKAAIDAAYVAVSLGPLQRLEVAFAPHRRRKAYRLGLRYTTHVGEYDLSFMGGYFREDVVVGGDVAGYLGEAGLRGEWTYTWPARGSSYLRALVNMDYQFSERLYGFVEGYFNGLRLQGASPSGGGLIYGTRRYYGALYAQYQIHPLMYLSLYVLGNVEDGSYMIGPLLQYALLQDWELGGGVYYFGGGPDTELGMLKPLIFGMLQFYF